MESKSGNYGKDLNLVHFGSDGDLSSDELVLSKLDDSYAIEQIDTAIQMLEAILRKGDLTQLDLINLYRQLGMRAHNLDLTGSNETSNTLRHTHGIYRTALMLLQDGHKVKLIEATTPRNVKVLKDLDLLTVKDGVWHLIDYTQKPVDRYTVIPREKASEKYTKLESVFHQNARYKCLVVSMPIVFAWSDITYSFKKTQSAEFEQDMRWCEAASALVKQFRVSELPVMVEHHHSCFKDQSFERVVSRTQKFKKHFDEHKNELLNAVMTNGPSAAATFESFMDVVYYHGSKGIEDYSLQYFTKLQSCSSKNPFSYPVALRDQYLDNNPFQRLSKIAQMTEYPDPLMVILSLSEDGKLHPTLEEEKLLEHHPLWPLYQGIQVKRVRRRKDKEWSNAVRLKFTGESKSLHDISYSDRAKSMTDSIMGKETSSMKYNELESALQSSLPALFSKSTGSVMTSDISELAEHVLEGRKAGELMRTMMTSVVDLLGTSTIGSLLSNIQEVTLAMCVIPKKKKSISSKRSGFFKDVCHLSLDCVSDRLQVLVTNMNALLGQHVDQTYKLYGVFQPNVPLTDKTVFGATKWLNMSAADADWTSVLYHRTLSWVSNVVESSALNNTFRLSEEDIISKCVMPAMLMTVNSSRFAQASDMVRYIFVNSTGISNGTRELISKIDWYTPDSFPEKLYMLRLLKMSGLVQLFKSNNARGEITQKTASIIREGSSVRKSYNFRDWVICLPHLSSHTSDDMDTYNGLYVCRAFSIQRYNRLVSESQVINKQFESRRLFMSIRAVQQQHEARSLPELKTKEDLRDVILSTDFSKLKSGLYSPSPLAIIIGFMVSLLKLPVKPSELVSDAVKRIYNLSSVMWALTISEVMNNRGSVSTHNYYVVNYAERGSGVKKEISSQNDKCYNTLLKLTLDYVEDRAAPIMPDSYTTDYARHDLSSSDYSKLITVSDNLAPIILRVIDQVPQFVSKMVHKDQVGIREIAVMNSYARVSCFYIEELARRVRDSEHNYGDRTNLIEIENKDDIVSTSYNQSRYGEKDTRDVLYDSADCSKWGPSMNPHLLYLILSLRMDNSNHDSVLYSLMSLFSNKLFKIPDWFYKHMDNMNTDLQTNSVLRAAHDLSTMPPEMGSLELQCIRVPEGMHQGILGCTSSVLAADCMRLSIAVSKTMNKFIQYDGFVTSDDQARVMVTNATENEEEFESNEKMINKTLNVHLKVSQNYGIERNMSKSTHSPSVMEFNSIFYTPNGIVKGDIKSRLSYVDFGHSSDPFQNSLRCSKLAAEFLKSENSLAGACWIQLLNTHLAMLQNQSRTLYKLFGKSIFELPLELGGFPSINPLLAVSGTDYMPILPNYCPSEIFDEQLSLSLLTEFLPTVGLVNLTEDEREMKSSVPSLSRSSVVHLCKKDLRDNRRLREAIKKVNRTDYLSLVTGKDSRNLLYAMFSCLQREETRSGVESSYERYSGCITPDDAKLYRLSKTIFSKEGRLSRLELRQFCAEWMTSKTKRPPTVYDGKFKFMGHEVELITLPLNYGHMRQLYDEVQATLDSIRVLKVYPASRLYHYHKIQFDVADSGFVESMLQEFDLKYKPIEMLGLNTEIHPALYLESRMLYQQRMSSLCRKKTFMKLVMLEADVGNMNLSQAILVNCYYSGSRIDFEVDKSYRRQKFKVDKDLSFLLPLRDKSHKCYPSGRIVDILSSSFPHHLRGGSVSKIDITTLINATMGTDDNFEFNDNRVMTEVLRVLLCFEGPYVLKPDRLKPLIGHSRIYSTSKRRYYNDARVKDSLPVGLSCIVENRGVFTHFETILTRYDSETKVNSKQDVYKVLHAHELDYLNVNFFISDGLAVLCADKHIIRTLCSAPIDDDFTIEFFTRSLLTKDVVDEIKVMDPYSHDLLQHELKEHLTIQRSVSSVEIVKPEKAEFLDTLEELLGDDDDDPIWDKHLVDILGDAQRLSAAESLRNKTEDHDAQDKLDAIETVYAMIPGVDNNDVLDDVDEPDTKHSDSQYRHYHSDSENSAIDETSGEMREATGVDDIPFDLGDSVTQQAVTRSMPNLMWLMSSNAVVSHQKDRVGNHRYVIKFPYRTKKSRYKDKDGGSALRQLIDEIMMSDRDSLWKVGYIREVIRYNSALASQYEELLVEAADLFDMTEEKENDSD
jgi:hypothetical protein